jgi:hypothetical protein
MSDYEYTGEMVEDVLALRRQTIALYDKATLAYYNQSSEFRAQQVLDAISRLERSIRNFQNSVRRRESELADEREREAAE